MMLQALLSLMLVAAQVLSWNAAPLYLCLEADGSSCVDFGPETCGCCHESDGAGGGCPQHATCNHEKHAASHTQGESAVVAPCGCTHVQISAPQSATIGRMIQEAGAFEFHGPLAIVTVPEAQTAMAALAHALEAPITTVGSDALSLRAGIVLRC